MAFVRRKMSTMRRNAGGVVLAGRLTEAFVVAVGSDFGAGPEQDGKSALGDLLCESLDPCVEQAVDNVAVREAVPAEGDQGQVAASDPLPKGRDSGR